MTCLECQPASWYKKYGSCSIMWRDGCSRSIISRRRSGLMDRTSPPRNPAPPSAGRSPGTTGRSARRRSWPSVPYRCRRRRRRLSEVKGFLPSLNLAGVDLVPAGQLGHRVLSLHRLKACSRSERGPSWPSKPGSASFVLSTFSNSIPTGAVSLGAGLSLGHPANSRGPPNISVGTKIGGSHHIFLFYVLTARSQVIREPGARVGNPAS